MIKSFDNITDITISYGSQPCDVDIDALHRVLMHLPYAAYIELYKLMNSIIYDAIKGDSKNA